jgi:hypothetical protein
VIGIPVLLAYATLRIFTQAFEPLSEWWNLARCVFYVIIALFLGFLIGIVAAGIMAPFLQLFLDLCGRANGAPFQKGDRVRVLVGPYRDQILRVLRTSARDSVEIVFGNEEKPDDIRSYCPWQLVRATETDSDASTNDGPTAS